MSEASISVDDPQAMLSLFGPRDQHLRRIREALDVRIAARNGQIVVEGAESSVSKATDIFEQLKAFLTQHGNLDFAEVERTLGNVLGVGATGGAAGNGKQALVEVPAIDVFQAARKDANQRSSKGKG